MKNTTIENRSELLFLYDVKYANPNGDPMDVNRPRMDEDSMKCLVTDVRLKRTIRDYIDTSLNHEQRNGNEIFIKEIIKEDGNTASVKDRIRKISKDANTKNLKEIKEFILKTFIDTRLFGATYPVELAAEKKKKKDEETEEIEESEADSAEPKKKEKEGKDSITLTGPVQFNIGSSLHKVKEVPFNLSLVMASGEGKKTGSLAEGGKKTIKYGLIGFHGVINEVASKLTQLSQEDVELLLKGMWIGTKELLTTSKKGHMPRLLIKVNYQPGFFIGDLLELIKPDNKNNSKGEQIEDEQIESVSDFILNTKTLNEVLKKHKDKIISIQVKKDDRLELSEPIFNSSELIIE